MQPRCGTVTISKAYDKAWHMLLLIEGSEIARFRASSKMLISNEFSRISQEFRG